MDKEIKDRLKSMKKHRERQIVLFDKLMVKPLKDNINLIDRVIKNEVPFEHLVIHSKAINKRIKEIWKVYKNETKNKKTG